MPEKYEPNPCSPSCETNGCPDDVERCSGRPGVPVPDDYDERRREALGCTHPADEPCFGSKPGADPARHAPPPQGFITSQRAAMEQGVGQSFDPPPSHYEGDGGLDPWAYIAAHGLDYWAGNVIKYVTRAGRKEIASVEDDLIKARNYLNYMIDRERRGE